MAHAVAKSYGTLKTFPGGVHPSDRKELSRDCPIEDAPIPERVYIPLSQHIGAPCKPVVEKGDTVRMGQVVGEAGGFVSAPVHASVSGTVAGIEERIHIFGAKVPCVVIDNDGRDQWFEGCNQPVDYSDWDHDAIRGKVRQAGLAGMGGATFPTHVKFSPPPEKPIDTVIINGVECEPYLTCDYRLMLESPQRIIDGAEIILRAVRCNRCIIAVEANKPDAYEVMREYVSGHDKISVEMLEVKYPQGAEKQLIKALLGREVPSGGLPMDVGALVSNVGTTAAVYDAVALNKPLIERLCTVTGEGVERPSNFLARIGTPLTVLLEKTGMRPGAKKFILGGPMMGLAQFTTDLVVIKGTSGVLVLMEADSGEYENCIRCGRCVDACPTYLIPSELSILAEAGEWEAAKEKNVLDCIECGVCAYVCPARRPIVHLIKLAKAELLRMKKEFEAKKKAAEAKE
ncbi:MAG: electron transport complex subunit RsxC [Planctomycetota bacterium]|nr:MAG: electron transport complex subunit RsxC [Planctomycetota bacterium]